MYIWLIHFESESESRSVVSDSATPWTIQSMEFSRSEYWSGLPFPSPGDLPNPGIEPRSSALQADFLPTELSGNFAGQNTGVGRLSLLLGIFPTHRLNPGLSHCSWILVPAEPQGKPILSQRSIVSHVSVVD